MILSKDKRDFLIILIGRLLQIFIMIFSVRVLTHLLTPKEMGNIYIFTTIYTFFVFSFISPFGQYINRHTHKWQKEKSILNNLGLYFLYLVCISFFSMFIAYFIYTYGIVYNMSLYIYLFLTFSFVLFLTLNQTILPILNMLHWRFSFIILNILTALGILIFGYILILTLDNSAENWLMGTLLSNVLFMGIGFIILKIKLQEKFNGVTYNLKRVSKEKIKSISRFIIPLSAATLFMWLQNSGYRILIEQNISLEFLGFFGVGMAISSQIAGVIESIISQYFYPIYYQQISNASKNSRKKAINELINIILPIYFMMALLITFLSKYIVMILVDLKYYDVYIFTTFGIWIEFFRMTTNIFGNISQSEMNTKKFMIPYIIGSLLTIVFVYFSSINSQYRLYLPFSLIGGGFLTMIMMYFSMKKLIDFSINLKLLLISFFISLPYLCIYFIKIEINSYANFLIVMGFGLYFLGTIFYIYKQGQHYDYS